MNIGSLYLVKKCFWLLHPTKEAAEVLRQLNRLDAINPGPFRTEDDAAYWSKQLNCEATYFSPDSIVVFLEEDGEFKKFLTSDGRIGWTWLIENYNDCFEEMKSKS